MAGLNAAPLRMLLVTGKDVLPAVTAAIRENWDLVCEEVQLTSSLLNRFSLSHDTLRLWYQKIIACFAGYTFAVIALEQILDNVNFRDNSTCKMNVIDFHGTFKKNKLIGIYLYVIF